MNTKALDAVAKATLYEGYMLYPYRPSSIKNRQRFNFGVLYPRSYCEAQSGSDSWTMQTECLVQGSLDTEIEIKVRFLRLIARSDHATLAAAQSTPWQEAVESEVAIPIHKIADLRSLPATCPFDFPAQVTMGDSRDRGGNDSANVVRSQQALCGAVQISAEAVSGTLFRLRVQVQNLSPGENGEESRDHALMRSLVSAHTLLGASGGEFISLLDPPREFAEAAAACTNVGTWPVLVGSELERDTMLSSPVILYDYPQIAPESPGDLFDGTEIDEILALRIMTLTEDEKQEIRNSDERARHILERTENLSPEHFTKLHGVLRELRPVKEDLP